MLKKFNPSHDCKKSHLFVIVKNINDPLQNISNPACLYLQVKNRLEIEVWKNLNPESEK